MLQRMFPHRPYLNKITISQHYYFNCCSFSCRPARNEIPSATPMFSGVNFLMAETPTFHHAPFTWKSGKVTPCRKSQHCDAAVVILLVDQLATKFQVLPPCYWWRAFQWHKRRPSTMHCSPGKVEKSLHYLERRLDRWYQQNSWTKRMFSGLVNMVELMGAVCADKSTGKVTPGPGKHWYSARKGAISVIPKAIPMLSGSPDTMALRQMSLVYCKYWKWKKSLQDLEKYWNSGTEGAVSEIPKAIPMFSE